MTNSVKAASNLTASDAGLADLIAEITDRLLAGQPVDVEEYASRRPELAEQLRRLVPALAVMHEIDSAARPNGDAVSDPAPPLVPADGMATGVLGDFRILREVGRGGMGVVYEAEQVSLGRRVALKVLPFAGAMDPRHVQRFQNEARAAACLHHSNIVPVYYVGSERGVNFYAMQFIEGQTLADLIRVLRQPAGEAAGPVAADVPTTAHVPANGIADPKADTQPAARQSTLGPGRGREYYRRVAELGVQAAEALDHAHQLGIVHRDIKPANLLLDGRGCVWIADFGLAHIQHGEANLTMTGDLMGTLRYMSPEQALAKRVPIDHRTDVYSLGATLYELLTLRPAVEGKDRQEVLRQIAFEEPKPPGRIAKGVPAELEVIVLKAMEKNPAERYGTAQEMADDLRRFLDDKPIRARRPSWRKVAAIWARRHRTVVWAAAVVAVIAVLFAGGTGVVWARQRAVVEAEVGAALREAADFQEQGKWPEALAAARSAETLANAGPADEGLRERVRRRRAELDLVAKLQELNLQSADVELVAKLLEYGSEPEERKLAVMRDDPYARAFQQYGIDVAALRPAEAGAKIRATGVSVELAAALDDWAVQYKGTRTKGDSTWRDLLATARVADPDDWRNQVRDALEQPDLTALKDLASSDRAAELPPLTVTLLGRVLTEGDSADLAAALLRKAQMLHPADFWINEELARALLRGNPPQEEESIRFATAAVSLRPQSPSAWVGLADALAVKGRVEEAVAAYKKAIHLKPDYAEAYYCLGTALARKGSLDEAIAAYTEAARLKPQFCQAYCGLIRFLTGNSPLSPGTLDRAVALCKAIPLKPDFAEAYYCLGKTMQVCLDKTNRGGDARISRPRSPSPSRRRSASSRISLRPTAA